jgi:hypothetical protein
MIHLVILLRILQEDYLVFPVPFFELFFLFFRCGIDMHLSRYFLSESPFMKWSVYVSIMVLDSRLFYHNIINLFCTPSLLTFCWFLSYLMDYF